MDKFSPVPINPVLPPEDWGDKEDMVSKELLKKLQLVKGKKISLETYSVSGNDRGENLDYDTEIFKELAEPIELGKPIKFKNSKFTGVVKSIRLTPPPNEGKYTINIDDSIYFMTI